jgi:hypothetical protein
VDGKAWAVGSGADRDGVREVKPISLVSHRRAGLVVRIRTARFGLAPNTWWARAVCDFFSRFFFMLFVVAKRKERGSEVKAEA